MPSASSSSVFQRLTGKRQPQDIDDAGSSNSNTRDLDTPDDGDSGTPHEPHRRESSILSLSSSVTDLGHNVRRSVSLRSHRRQDSGSGASIGHRPRYPSSSNLLARSPKSPSLTSPAESHEPEPPIPQVARQHTAPPPAARSRSKLGISARSFSQRFKSTDNLSLAVPLGPDQVEGAEQTTPPALAVEPPKTAFSMLAAAPALPKRLPPDRPILHPQASFVRDISSSHGSIANGASLQPTTTASTVTAGNPNAIFQSIQETSAKRMATIDYLRRVHEGNCFYFSTLHYTPPSLNSSIPSLQPHKLGRRATGYLFLGYSLPLLQDLNASVPLEYLRTLSALLHEFETYQSLAGIDGSGSSLSRAKVQQMFRTGMGLGKSSGMRTGRRASAATDSIVLDTQRAGMLGIPQSGGGDAGSPQELPSPISSGHDFHHLLTPHLPFEPDFNVTFTTLCDSLIDTYTNLLSLVSGPDLCSPAVGDAFAKADKAVRKILVSNIVQEFENTTRHGVKGEVAGLGKVVLGGLM
ncbi:hypothetical protein LTR08_007069 [Meristemomyces frigidus]|nr:hypothetical protein LTR08_007069 [Meristemomyces frigidus]